LSGEDITDEDYEHAQKVWKVFGCKTFRDYHNLYNKADVLQLADIFESFRDVALRIISSTLYGTTPLQA
jgi:hypothetical protein